MPTNKPKKDRAPTQYVWSKSLMVGPKSISASIGENSHGKFVCLVEIIRGKRNAVYFPSGSIDEVISMLESTRSELQRTENEGNRETEQETDRSLDDSDINPVTI